MFKATKPFKDTITGYDKEPSLRIGVKVPQNAVNLAYYFNPTATNSEKVIASDPPRMTIDHRIETKWLTKIDQASGPNGEPPSNDLFPKFIHYSDEEGYYGKLTRQDETVKWYPERHVDQKEVHYENIQIVTNKGDEDKVVEYSDADGYKGNLYLDTITYEAYTTRDASITQEVDYTINDFELNFYEIFGTYLKSDEMNDGPWTHVPNAIAGEDYCWPARIELTATNLKASDSGLASTNTNNRIANYINNLTNNWDGSNEQFVNNPDIISTSKPVGFLYFDKLEYEPVTYDVPPTDGSISQEREVNNIISDDFPWELTDISLTTYTNVLPTIDDVKIGGAKIKTSYLADLKNSNPYKIYEEIEDFMMMIDAHGSGSYSTVKAILQNAIDNGKDIAIWLSSLKFVVNDKTIDMLVDGNLIEGNERNELNPSANPSMCHFIIGYKYIISDKGTEGTILYNITVNYHSITLENGNCSVRRTLTTKKKEAASYNAYCQYSGLVNKNWIDYDGIAYYIGSVTKGNSIGNQNASEDNEILMFPDQDGYLRQIVQGIKTTTDEDNRPVHTTEMRSYYRIEADTVYVTDVFKDGEGCFYKYRLKQPIYDYRGPDENGFYKGDAVQLFTSAFKDIPNNYKHNMKLITAKYEEETHYDRFNNPIITTTPKCYFADLYTNFISSSTDTFKIVYNGFNDVNDDNKILDNGIEEDIYNAPYMIEGIDYRLCSVNRKMRLSYIQILNYVPLKDERLRITFKWKVVATSKIWHRTFETDVRQSSILNKEYCIPCEYSNFEGRGMIISPKLNGDSVACSPKDLCLYDQSCRQSADDSYQPVITDTVTDFIYTVQIIEINKGGTINIKCNPDGSGVITAETTLDTGFYDYVHETYDKKLDIENPYWTDGEYIYKGYKVKCIDSRNIRIKPPREERLLDSWYPLIQFGHFSRIMDQYGAHTKICYSMPEYDTQHYSTAYGQPYVDINDEQVTIINPHMVKTKCYPLHIIEPRANEYDNNVFTYNGKMYQVIEEAKSWNAAEEYCKLIGGHLAMPKTQDEIDFLVSITSAYDFEHIWLGANNNSIDEVWRWVDGSPVEYFNWIEGQPNNSAGEEHYLDMYTKELSAGKWNDLRDSSSLVGGFVCEFCLNISLFKKVDNEYFKINIKDISFSDGIIITKEAISENDNIVANYTYLEENYSYRGYWRDDADFVRIDLNPNIYHTYNNPVYLPSEVSPSKNLFNKVIYFFMRPTGVYEVNSDFDDLQYSIDGFKAVPVSRTRTVQKPVTRTQTRTIKVKDVENKEIHEIQTNNSSFVNDTTPKDIMTFTLSEEEQPYSGPFTVTMNTGHWYGFRILKAVYDPDPETGAIDYENPLWQQIWSGENRIHKTPNTPEGFPTHYDNVPLSMTYEDALFEPGETYKIQTWECAGGGTSADKFIYSFSLGQNPETQEEFNLNIGVVSWHEEEEEYNVTTIEDVEEEYIGTDLVPLNEVYETIKENDVCLYHRIDNAEPFSDEDMMLGSVYIRQDTSLHSTIITDARTRGGGILTGISDSLRHELEPESDYYLDIGYYDGKPYQENGVIIVRLDNRLLKEYGGRFTVGDVEQKVKRWAGAGIYPIIEFVDSYKKEDLPQYNLEIEDSYTNVIDIIPVIYAEDNQAEAYIEPIEVSYDIVELDNSNNVRGIDVDTNIVPLDFNISIDSEIIEL